jgi:steroid 5-alpha reductase family enzyme
LKREEIPLRPVPAIQCYLAYGTAIITGWLFYRILAHYQVLEDPFLTGMAITSLSTLVIWIFSIIHNNSSIYDPYWVIAPPFLAILLKALGEEGLTGLWNSRQVLVLLCLCIWASRYHIFYKWTGWRTGLIHEDWRYDMMRKAPIPYWLNSLIGMHLFPTFLVYFAFAPAALVISGSSQSQASLNMWDILGLSGALIAVTIQLVADEQLRKFRQTDEYRSGKSCRTGLWQYSRHPNYFGEVLFWISMIFFALASGIIRESLFLVLGGPVLMAVFFRFSAYLMDIRSLKLRNDYRQLMDEVSPMIPWWPKAGR